MKAAVHARYGPPEVVQILEVPTPQPAAGEVRVQVHATTVTRTDCGMRGPHPWFVRLGAGLLRPRNTILGMDFAGVVHAVGPGVTDWQVGERVFGLSPEVYGAHAEFLCVSAAGPMARLPAGAAFHECVVGEGAWYADTYLQKLRLGPGRRLLVYGAAGAIGTAAVLLAKATGASVTAVVATPHMDMARSLGADRVVDYTAEDFTAIGETFDAVLDAVGKTSYFRCRRLLKPGGTFAATDLGPGWQNVWLSLGSALVRSERVIFPLPQVVRARAVLERLRGLMEAHAYRAVVDRRYPLAAIVDAYRYVETGQKTGVVVVDVVAG
ncbi:MAG: NAD(P)-dependent alcohol dehydrogenase [Rubrivivax sp.]|nr:NAD(P)-dependent alcohol dehydrogenase [Rubrivivax sp.]